MQLVESQSSNATRDNLAPRAGDARSSVSAIPKFGCESVSPSQVFPYSWLTSILALSKVQIFVGIFIVGGYGTSGGHGDPAASSVCYRRSFSSAFS